MCAALRNCGNAARHLIKTAVLTAVLWSVGAQCDACDPAFFTEKLPDETRFPINGAASGVTLSVHLNPAKVRTTETGCEVKSRLVVDVEQGEVVSSHLYSIYTQQLPDEPSVELDKAVRMIVGGYELRQRGEALAIQQLRGFDKVSSRQEYKPVRDRYAPLVSLDGGAHWREVDLTREHLLGEAIRYVSIGNRKRITEVRQGTDERLALTFVGRAGPSIRELWFQWDPEADKYRMVEE